MIQTETSKNGLLSRFVAWKVLEAVAAGAYADFALDKTLKNHAMKAADKALSTEIAYGAIRQRKYLDSWIDHLAKVSAERQPPRLRWLLHIGLYQIFKMERVPASAIVNTTVELAKKSDIASLSSVVNGILRNAIRSRDSGQLLPPKKNFEEHLAQEFSVPSWLAKELIVWRGSEGAKCIAKAFNQVPSLDLRVNRCKATIKTIQEKFEKRGIQSSQINDCPDGLHITSSFGDVSCWPGYVEGYWSVQDRSSQWIAPLLEAQPGERILDACSAPGGKATHLAELINDDGEIWAVDRSAKRLQKVAANAARLGLTSLNCFLYDASSLLDVKPHWKNYFHRILIDAPCSGLGTLARNPDARWRITPPKIHELTLLQASLLRSLSKLLMPGGKIVYSTCTIHPDENFNQIQRFVQSNLGMRLTYQKQIWPDPTKLGDGFFAAVIEYK
ncbi:MULTISPECIES: 16S rRNA (cytosine(967)-C(5))-methyltransferase [Prochlorococcus]|uniref:16S rRNA (cytosine(967)-C(5))-methyltransferase n=1 Tax=Prochlorococcus TaxID=1218 RepID=UPI0005338A42|nr:MULTISPECIES: 16S rRNA (cytosine(967)-C(5))-methyltransferase [Prochlorococcus]KGG12971.1 Ribosomal RNA small subunit methyltransferase B [Prochlorococcus sp. MIT 0601]